MGKKVGYVTDVEGNLDFFVRYVERSEVLKWKEGAFDETKAQLEFRDDDTQFVFGGDSQDKGIGDVRFVKLLLDLKQRFPERVHWIIGNRDCNKLRLAAELSDEAIKDTKVHEDKEFPYWVKAGTQVTPADYLKEINEQEHTKANRLRWMLKHTMGADGAFERRKMELGLMQGRTDLADDGSVTDDDVVNSFLKEVDPSAADDDKFMLRYLEQGKLMHLIGNTLFVHGALKTETFGTVPGKSGACADVKTWMNELNAWKETEVAAFKANPSEGKNSKTRAGHGLMDYGVPGGNGNKTVICETFLVDGNAAKLEKEVVEKLAKAGIDTVVVGHIPHGECPTVIRTKLAEGAVTVVMADTSYSKMGHKSEWGVDNRADAASEVIIYEDATASVHGVLADGKTEIEYDVPLERKAAKTDVNVGDELVDGSWIKAKLKGKDEYVTAKGKGFRLDCKTLSKEALVAREKRVAFLTDVEGNFDYVNNYMAISKVLKWTDDTKTALDFQNDKDQFVFGGDTQDKGVGDVRFVRLLLGLKAKYPERVHWIIGNRDCNKLRLAAELSDEAIKDTKVQEDKEFPYWVKAGTQVTPADYLKEINEQEHTKANRLRWMLKHTMGADGAFERRKMELGLMQGRTDLADDGSVTDDDVVNSFLKEVDASAGDDDKFMLRYLEQGKLMHLIGNTLFVHGALKTETFGTVPGKSGACADVKTWMNELNAWKETEVAAFKANPSEGKNSKTRAGHGLMDYGVPGGNGNKTVICETFLVDGNAAKLEKEVVEKLAKAGIDTVVVGHIPHGECPTVIRTKLAEGAVTVVMADTSYSKMGHKSEWGVDNRADAASEVIIYEDATASVHGVLADGKTEIEYDVPLERKAAKTDVNVGDELVDGSWIKAKLKGKDEYVTAKGKGFRLDCKTLSKEALVAREKRVAFLTDVEGNFDYVNNYMAISKVLKWTDDTKTALDFQNDKDQFVFGGDTQDKGVGDVRFVRLLLGLKAKYPERVHWIIGNRDCNKLRLAAELSDEAIKDTKVQEDKEFPYWVKAGTQVTPADYLKEINEQEHTKANRLRWMLKHTMGADGAFERRKMELGLMQGRTDLADDGSVTDDDVVNSFLKEVDPSAADDDKFMLRYLEQGKLMHLIGNTLFVHGALKTETFGTVPGKSGACADVKTWMNELNAWKETEVAAFKANPSEGKNSKTRAGHGLMDYGVPGGNGNKTVICETFLVDGNAAKLEKEVVEKLAKAGIDTVVVGHIPHGECPTVIRTKLAEGAVTVVMADTSYSKMGHKSEWGVDNRADAASEVIIYEDATASVHGVLADGKTEIEYDVPLERKAAKTDVNVGDELVDGSWIKAKLKGKDEYVTAKGKGFRLDCKTLSKEALVASQSDAAGGKVEVKEDAQEDGKEDGKEDGNEDGQQVGKQEGKENGKEDQKQEGKVDGKQDGKNKDYATEYKNVWGEDAWVKGYKPEWRFPWFFLVFIFLGMLFFQTQSSMRAELLEARLLSSVADIDALAPVSSGWFGLTKDGKTALHMAVEKDRAELVELLLRHGANPLATDQLQQTPRLVAEKLATSEVVALLADAEETLTCGAGAAGHYCSVA